MRVSRVHTLSASAASWLPGKRTQGPLNDCIWFKVRRSVSSATAFVSKCGIQPCLSLLFILVLVVIKFKAKCARKSLRKNMACEPDLDDASNGWSHEDFNVGAILVDPFLRRIRNCGPVDPYRERAL